MSLPETFTLNDSEGFPHTYVVRPHPATEALKLLTDLITVGVGPMVRFLQGSWMATPEAAAAAESRDFKVADLLQTLDVDKIATSFSEGLVKAGGLEKLAPQLLRYTSRDGVDITRGQIDIAYTGNLAEMLAVLQRVWDYNGFFGALSTLISR